MAGNSCLTRIYRFNLSIVDDGGKPPFFCASKAILAIIFAGSRLTHSKGILSAFAGGRVFIHGRRETSFLIFRTKTAYDFCTL